MNFSPIFSISSCYFCRMLLEYPRVRSSRRKEFIIHSARNLIDTDAVVIKSNIVLGDQAAATLLQNGDDLFDDRELDVFSPHKPKKFLNHWM